MLLANECFLEGNTCIYTYTYILMHMHTYTNTCVELNLCGVLFLFYGSNSFIKVTMLVLALIP